MYWSKVFFNREKNITVWPLFTWRLLMAMMNSQRSQSTNIQLYWLHTKKKQKNKVDRSGVGAGRGTDQPKSRWDFFPPKVLKVLWLWFLGPLLIPRYQPGISRQTNLPRTQIMRWSKETFLYLMNGTKGLSYLGEYPLAWAACLCNETVYNLLIGEMI